MSNLPNDKPLPTCPRCGRSLQEYGVDGLCAACLGALHFVTDTASPSTMLGENDPSKLSPLPLEKLAAHFPHLEITEFLGRGGMGVVYKAQQKSLSRTVALKLLAPERADDPKFAMRFIQEARALAALSHPNIVTIHDFGQAGGYYYLLMEYVDGVNLRQAMAAGRLEPEQALAIVPPVCEALQYAHEHQIVHCDIKPENLLLDKVGRIKIVDFGIARMLGTDSLADFAESQPAGTPQYMAPEQWRPGLTDHRADIYSLGVVLYEMLTGDLPTGPLQPPSRSIQVDVRIDEIVLRALEASPEMRFRSAAEFGTSVAAVTRRDGAGLGPKRSVCSRSGLALWGAAWAAICLLSLPFLEMAWVGGFGATLMGWMAVSEILRSDGRVRGLRLAVFDLLLFPLLTVNAAMIAVYARLITTIRNQPYPAMGSPSWPFIVIGLGLLTLLLVVLLDILVARVVWRRLRRSHTTEGGAPPNSWGWRFVVGSLLAVVGGAVLLVAPRINELVDDFQLTKSARDHHIERLTQLYLLGGGLIAVGLLASLRDVRRSGRLIAANARRPRMTGTATVQTPAELASIWNQFFCYRTRGPLILEENLLIHSHAGGSTSIPLQAIRDVSIGRLPRLMNPAGLSVLCIGYEHDGEIRQVLISPLEGWFQFSQEAVSEWFAAIRSAVVRATGRKPSLTPPEQLGIPRSSRRISWFLVAAGALLLLVLYGKHADESRQTAMLSGEAARELLSVNGIR